MKALDMGAVETLVVWENLDVMRYRLQDIELLLIPYTGIIYWHYSIYFFVLQYSIYVFNTVAPLCHLLFLLFLSAE